MSGYEALREEAWQCNDALPRAGLVIGTFGNASACDRSAGVFAIKPSGVPFHRLQPEDMVVVDMMGEVVEGTLRPSSDMKTHLVLYNAWKDIGGIVHTHSPHAVAWAQARRPIPVLGTTHADALARDIPCTGQMTPRMVQGDYERATGRQILRTVTGLSHREIRMVLVAGHGPFTWGETVAEALENSIVLELIAHTALLTRLLNPRAARLSQHLLQKHYRRKHGPDAYYGQY